MKKLNCWEFKKCGRQFGGEKATQLGVCPAATQTKTHGVNGGNYAGRCCWAVAGTLCGGQVQGTYATKLTNCLKCEFYQAVKKEEGANLKTSKEILGLISN